MVNTGEDIMVNIRIKNLVEKKSLDSVVTSHPPPTSPPLSGLHESAILGVEVPNTGNPP